MLLKLGTLVKCRKTLIKLNRVEGFDSVTAYRILKNSHVIDKELRMYDEQQAKLVHKYCKRDKKGKPVINDKYYTIEDEYKEIYEREIENLFNEDLELKIYKISIDSISKVGLSPNQLGLIEFMLFDDNSEREDK